LEVGGDSAEVFIGFSIGQVAQTEYLADFARREEFFELDLEEDLSIWSAISPNESEEAKLIPLQECPTQNRQSSKLARLRAERTNWGTVWYEQVADDQDQSRSHHRGSGLKHKG
jgi:hypothetical protein